MKWVCAALALSMLMLIGVGLVILASTGDAQGAFLGIRNPNHFAFQQARYAVIAVLGCALLACVPPSLWFRGRMPWCIAAFVVVGLLSVHTPLGFATKGARRWITLPGFQLQPSEFVKVAVIPLTAWWAGAPGRRNRNLWEGVLIPCVGFGLVVAGFLAQSDLGSSVMMLAVNVSLLYLAGARFWKHLFPLALIALLLFFVYLVNDPVRMRRFGALDWLLPSVEQTVSDGAGSGGVLDADTHQVNMSRKAFARGRWTGVGLGNSICKERYLPEYHTDFILAMVGEELGLAGTLSCVALFVVMTWCGFRIAVRAPDKRLRLLAAGMTLHVCLSAAVNVGVVTGSLPTKGLALPFLSYGGSSLVASAAAIGLLLAVGLRPGADAVRSPPPSAVGESTDLWNV